MTSKGSHDHVKPGGTNKLECFNYKGEWVNT